MSEQTVPRKAKASGPGVSLVGVAIEYPDAHSTRRILTDFDLEALPGQVVAISGRSGAGRSSLLRIAYGQQEPMAGSVTWQGRALADLDERQRIRRERFGYTSRDALVLED